MPEILAIIPARAGSKRIPDKNIKLLNGRPLIEYTISSAIHCDLINHTVLSTNIPAETLSVAKYKHFDYHPRVERLCGDKVGDLAVISDVLQIYGDGWDLVVYLRPTTPMRSDGLICSAIEQIIAAQRNATGLRSVELMGESAFKCFTMPSYLSPITDNGADCTDLPNQLVRPTYRANGYIDICKPEIIKRGKLWGDWVIGFVTPRTVELDTMDDWLYAEFLMQRDVKAPLIFGRKEIKP